jgi:hypothetical protein
LLIAWIEEKESTPKQFAKLIYKATIDGFQSAKFHEQCDHKLNTISLIFANNFIFGGFTLVSWHQEGEYGGNYKDDPFTEIFSISNPWHQTIKFKYNSNDGFAIFCDNKCGPNKGGCDICIKNNSNENEASYSNLGASFKGFPFKYGTNKVREFLCGSYYFRVQEIEVYQLF